MDVTWMVPAAVAAMGLVGAALMARRITIEADALERDVRGFGEQRLAMVEVRDASRDVLDAARARRITR